MCNATLVFTVKSSKFPALLQTGAGEWGLYNRHVHNVGVGTKYGTIFFPSEVSCRNFKKKCKTAPILTLQMFLIR